MDHHWAGLAVIGYGGVVWLKGRNDCRSPFQEKMKLTTDSDFPLSGAVMVIVPLPVSPVGRAAGQIFLNTGEPTSSVGKCGQGDPS